MNVLVTGANGFVGRNLIENLNNIRDGKNRTRPNIVIDEIFEYDLSTSKEMLEGYCNKADFVFHFAGVNRPQNNEDFMKGNRDALSEVLSTLRKVGNSSPVMLSSSIQASLEGRFADSEYGKSKLAAEEVLRLYGEETGGRTLIYRFPNIFGKWCRPNYNSVVATFCNAFANDLPYTVSDEKAELDLLYIDDLIEEMLDAIEGQEHRREDGAFCYVPTTHQVTLGRLVEVLTSFKNLDSSLLLPILPEGSFEKKLFSTYLSYLPQEKMISSLTTKADDRGSFTELFHTASSGQISVNITRPGVSKGNHWHNSKNEVFVVVSGRGLIKERKIGIDPETGEDYPVVSFEVSGDKMTRVRMLPGYTHSIENLSDTEDLITIMWANEIFDESHPDTFYENVE